VGGGRQASITGSASVSAARIHSMPVACRCCQGWARLSPVCAASGHACRLHLRLCACIFILFRPANGRRLSCASQGWRGRRTSARALWGSGAARTTSSSSSATGSRSFTAPIWKLTSDCHWFFSMDATPMSGYSCAREAPRPHASPVSGRARQGESRTHLGTARSQPHSVKCKSQAVRFQPGLWTGLFAGALTALTRDLSPGNACASSSTKRRVIFQKRCWSPSSEPSQHTQLTRLKHLQITLAEQPPGRRA